MENYTLFWSLILFHPGEIRYNDFLNGFMVTHSVHFTLLVLGLKKKCGGGGGGNTL